jgi:hypothetical protein
MAIKFQKIRKWSRRRGRRAFEARTKPVLTRRVSLNFEDFAFDKLLRSLRKFSGRGKIPVNLFAGSVVLRLQWRKSERFPS